MAPCFPARFSIAGRDDLPGESLTLLWMRTVTCINISGDDLRKGISGNLPDDWIYDGGNGGIRNLPQELQRISK